MALWICRGIEVLQLPTNFKEVTIVRISSLTRAIVYFTPAQLIDGPIQKLVEDFIQADGPLILLRDFNCRIGIIPRIQMDRRGEFFENLLIAIEAYIWISNAPT